jgi:hypothetical protein
VINRDIFGKILKGKNLTLFQSVVSIIKGIYLKSKAKIGHHLEILNFRGGGICFQELFL